MTIGTIESLPGNSPDIIYWQAALRSFALEGLKKSTTQAKYICKNYIRNLQDVAVCDSLLNRVVIL